MAQQTSMQSNWLSNISVQVTSKYLAQQTIRSEQEFIFSYTITITNNNDFPIKLLSRFWLITDGNGDENTVSGEGVIGEQPKIMPGKSYTYTSGCSLKTPVGTMQGHYIMTGEDQSLLQVPIDVFTLALPNTIN